MRTTLDIDDPILHDLKRLKAREGKSLSRLVSDLLAQALNARAEVSSDTPRPVWIAKPMRARIDLADKEAVQRALDQ